MFFVSYTLNHGDNNLTDHWLLVETAKDAAMELEALKDLGDLHCAAWGPIHGATEPQWLDQSQAVALDLLTDAEAIILRAKKDETDLTPGERIDLYDAIADTACILAGRMKPE